MQLHISPSELGSGVQLHISPREAGSMGGLCVGAICAGVLAAQAPLTHGGVLAGVDPSSEISSSSSTGVAGGSLLTSRTCWRMGYTFKFCCSRAYVSGNPECWDGKEFTYERCCLPTQATPAAFSFQDHNCERSGSGWGALLSSLEMLVEALDRGIFTDTLRISGGAPAVMIKLRRLLGQASGDCSMGRVAAMAGILLVCLTRNEGRMCTPHWAAMSNAMRHGGTLVTSWVTTTWPIVGLMRHITAAVTRRDPGCSLDTSIDWSMLHTESGLSEISYDAMKYLVGGSSREGGRAGTAAFIEDGCQGGHQWIASIKMAVCARTEAQCVYSHALLLNWNLRQASSSGKDLMRWAEHVGYWRVLVKWETVLREVMRHRYTLGLTPFELEALGIEASERQPLGCVKSLNRDGTAGVDKRAIMLLMEDDHAGCRLRTCRAQCGHSLDAAGRPWTAFGVGELNGATSCMCAGPPALQRAAFGGNCSAPTPIQLYAMPVVREGAQLAAMLLSLGPAAPVLGQAAGSQASLHGGMPVLVTMVWGRLAKYIPRFAQRLQRLQILNVVVFVLDDSAQRACEEARLSISRSIAVCLRGIGQTSLQKYISLLAYLVLGRDVFWFDFDSVWMKDPHPMLREAEQAELASRSAAGTPAASIFTAIDFDSTNCAMNAFFMIKASRSATVWLLSLVHWIYNRPYVHDQLAFVTFLGLSPLMDDEPVPSPLPWAPLDPNLFANADKFSGLGFSSDVGDLVLFHFFDGWNSNMPEGVEVWTTSTYRGKDLFEVLYGDDDEAAMAEISKSRRPPIVEPRDCSLMSSLGLGVELEWSTPSVPSI